MIVSISQPAYLPWLGYFDRIKRSDIHVVLDSVQLERSSKTRFTNRNRVRTKDGSCWLTVPIRTSEIGQPVICKAIINDSEQWQRKHYQTTKNFYCRAPFYNDYKEWFSDFYSQTWTLLSPMLTYSTNYFLEILGIQTKILYSSAMNAGGKKSDYILNLCLEAGATEYISGPFGRDYLDEARFSDHGICVFYHDYVHPRYSQVFPGFVPYLSIVDLLFNHGEQSLALLTSGQELSKR